MYPMDVLYLLRTSPDIRACMSPNLYRSGTARTSLSLPSPSLILSVFFSIFVCLDKLDCCLLRPLLPASLLRLSPVGPAFIFASDTRQNNLFLSWARLFLDLARVSGLVLVLFWLSRARLPTLTCLSVIFCGAPPTCILTRDLAIHAPAQTNRP